MRNPLSIASCLLTIALVAACSGSAATTTTEPAATTSVITSASTTTTTTAPTTTTSAPATITTAAPDAAPPELAGIWEGEVAPDDSVTLSLDGNSYTISRGGSAGSGRISVEGDIIRFSGSNLCSGEGTYRWTIEGDTLTLEITEAGDPCGGRRDVFDGVIYS